MRWVNLTGSKDSIAPSPRMAHCSAVWKHCIYVMGGRQNRFRMRDLWRFDTKTHTWTELQTKNAPPPRSGHNMVAWNGSLFMYGGSHDADTLYEIKLDSLKWSVVNITNAILPKMCGASMVMYYDSMIVFGIDDTCNFNECFLIDLKKLQFKNLSTSGRQPSPRFKHTAVVYKNEMFVFGGGHNLPGRKQLTFLNDFYSLDLISLVWREIRVPNSPSARNYHTAVVYENSIFLFGGYCSKDLGDFFEYDFMSKKWFEIPMRCGPGARSYHTAEIIGNKMYIFGGDDGKTLNELWSFQLDPRALPGLFSKLVHKSITDTSFFFAE